MAHNLKLTVYFWTFPFNSFRLRVRGNACKCFGQSDIAAAGSGALEGVLCATLSFLYCGLNSGPHVRQVLLLLEPLCQPCLIFLFLTFLIFLFNLKKN
jgi:hypothetical protein